MPTVWIRAVDRPKFHRSPDCRQITKPPSKGESHPVRAVELAEMTEHARPCKTCYPDAPRIKTAHRFCRICNVEKPSPCAHNGGVLVKQIATTKYVGLLRDPGDTFLRERWIWPDQAYAYELVAS